MRRGEGPRAVSPNAGKRTWMARTRWISTSMQEMTFEFTRVSHRTQGYGVGLVDLFTCILDMHVIGP